MQHTTTAPMIRRAQGLRGARMTDGRRRRGYTLPPDTRAFDRLNERLDSVEEQIPRMLEMMERQESENRMTRMEMRNFSTTLQEFGMQIQETRDESGRAKTAAQSVASAMPRVADGFWKTRLGTLVVVCSGFVAIIAGAKNIPPFIVGVMRVGGDFVQYMHDLDKERVSE